MYSQTAGPYDNEQIGQIHPNPLVAESSSLQNLVNREIFFL